MLIEKDPYLKCFVQINVRIMREEGFEPSQALSYWSLNPARLTTPAFPHITKNDRLAKTYLQNPTFLHVKKTENVYKNL